MSRRNEFFIYMTAVDLVSGWRLAAKGFDKYMRGVGITNRQTRESVLELLEHSYYIGAQTNGACMRRAQESNDQSIVDRCVAQIAAWTDGDKAVAFPTVDNQPPMRTGLDG